MLRDPTLPGNRVLRKTGVFTCALAVWMAIYRHATLGLGFGEPALVTFGLVFLLVLFVGIFGGVLAAGFYDAFLKAVGAHNRQPTVSVFFAEWLFAFTSPLMAMLVYVLLSAKLERPF